MKTKQKKDIMLERAKKRYDRLLKELLKAETTLSAAYDEHDNRIRYERMVKKLGYDPRIP